LSRVSAVLDFGCALVDYFFRASASPGFAPGRCFLTRYRRLVHICCMYANIWLAHVASKLVGYFFATIVKHIGHFGVDWNGTSGHNETLMKAFTFGC